MTDEMHQKLKTLFHNKKIGVVDDGKTVTSGVCTEIISKSNCYFLRINENVQALLIPISVIDRHSCEARGVIDTEGGARKLRVITVVI